MTERGPEIPSTARKTKRPSAQDFYSAFVRGRDSVAGELGVSVPQRIVKLGPMGREFYMVSEAVERIQLFAHNINAPKRTKNLATTTKTPSIESYYGSLYAIMSIAPVGFGAVDLENWLAQIAQTLNTRFESDDVAKAYFRKSIYNAWTFFTIREILTSAGYGISVISSKGPNLSMVAQPKGGHTLPMRIQIGDVDEFRNIYDFPENTSKTTAKDWDFINLVTPYGVRDVTYSAWSNNDNPVNGCTNLYVGKKPGEGTVYLAPAVPRKAMPQLFLPQAPQAEYQRQILSTIQDGRFNLYGEYQMTAGGRPGKSRRKYL